MTARRKQADASANPATRRSGSLLFKELLQLVLREISNVDDLHVSLARIMKALAQAVGGDLGYIGLVPRDSTRLVATASFGLNRSEVPALPIGGRSLTGWSYANKRTYLWPGGPNDDWYVPYNLGPNRVRQELVVPMIFNAEVIALVVVSSTRPGAFGAREQALVKGLAPEMALLLQNKRFYLAALRLAESIFPPGDDMAIAEVLAKAACKIMETAVTTVWMRSSESATPTLALLACEGGSYQGDELREIPASEHSVSWRAIKKAESHLESQSATSPGGDTRSPEPWEVCPDIQARGIEYVNREFAARNGLRSLISMPLLSSAGVLGVVNTYSRHTCKFLDKEVLLFRQLASHAAVAFEYSRQAERAKKVNEKILEIAQLSNPGQVALSFTHDARQVMNSINSGLSMLIEEFPSSALKEPPLRPIAETLQRDTQYLRQLFQSLTNYAKSPRMNFAMASVREAAEHAIYLFSPKTARGKLAISLKPSSGNEQFSIECVPDQVEQVLINLLNNSIYALERYSGGRGEVTVALRWVDGDLLEISVADTGPGIPIEKRPFVFEPWFSTKGKEGSGFGLAICRRIVEDNHGGSLLVGESATGGAVFFVLLPRRHDPRLRAKSSAAPEGTHGT